MAVCAGLGPYVTRRVFTRGMLQSLLTLSLVQTLCRRDALAGAPGPVAERWLVDAEDASRAVLRGTLQPIEWQAAIESLFARVDLGDLLRAIDLDRLVQTTALRDDQEARSPVDLRPRAGLPAELSFTPYFYALSKGQAIVPHGHHNLATMHMVVRGRARVRHFDRVVDEPEHLTIRATKDAVFAPGDLSTISDQRDNVHWFVALTEPVLLFNIEMHGMTGEQSSWRIYVDPARGERVGDGLIRAGKLNAEDAYRMYGKVRVRL